MKKQRFTFCSIFPRLLLVFFIGCFASMAFVHANEANDGAYLIEFVDNTNGLVVINDQQYRMRLNMKVIDSNKRILNRYALKTGQNVKFSKSFEKQNYYVDSIVILRK